MKVYARRDARGQILVYPEPLTVKISWTGAIRRRGKRYEECRYYGEWVDWTDVTAEVQAEIDAAAPQEAAP